MKDKKETPVSWLVEEIAEKFNFRFASFYWQHVQQALEMESKKLQKYDEMLVMLERLSNHFGLFPDDRDSIKKLIKEAKEL
jgi:uncharacterized protein (DUF305 family)